jgi:hypothetical protein
VNNTERETKTDTERAIARECLFERDSARDVRYIWRERKRVIDKVSETNRKRVRSKDRQTDRQRQRGEREGARESERDTRYSVCEKDR